MHGASWCKGLKATHFRPMTCFQLPPNQKTPENHPKLIYLNEKNHSFDRLRNLPSRL